MKYCCDKFKKQASSVLPFSGVIGSTPPEYNATEQFVPDSDGKTWNIHGCCGGGCCVVVEMMYCPYCGSKLESPVK